MVLHREAQKRKCESNERNIKAGTISRRTEEKQKRVVRFNTDLTKLALSARTRGLN